MTAIATRQEQSVPLAKPHTGFRPDIEGMRAVAVTLVVLSHAGMASLAGGYVGVDVFFVISGFLITTLLMKELDKTRTISLTGFYARRATRLLPASTVVLVATVIGAWLWLPATRFGSIATDAVVSTFYGINWRLAHEGVQYLNADAAPSPLQHFWSLAVEEQFYFVWPLLLLVCATFWLRRGRSGHLPVIIALCVVVAASLTVSITQTVTNAPWAYFGAHTRAWELGIGALIAMAAGSLTRLPRLLGAVLIWAGLAAVIASALLYGHETPFPGHAALLPVLGSAAIIAGGFAFTRRTILHTWPFQQIGKYSYSWYLWHWPVLMIGPAALGREPSLRLGLALAAGSFLLAIASYHLVEDPIRTRAWIKARSRRGLGIGLALSASAAALALIAGMFPPQIASGAARVETATAVGRVDDPEAELKRLVADSIGMRELPSNITPKVQDAKNDLTPPYADNCHIPYEATVTEGACVYGDKQGDKTVFLMGDSHGQHWFSAMDELAKKNKWKLAVRTKSACQNADVLAFVTHIKHRYDECVQWHQSIFDEIAETRPALVVLSSNDLGEVMDRRTGAMIDGKVSRSTHWAQAWESTFRSLKRSPQTRVALIMDTPWPAGDVPECLAKNAKNVRSCQISVKKAVREPQRRNLGAEVARANGATVIDPVPWFCTATVCPAVVGNLMVWKDNSHLSQAYSRMLAPILEKRLPPLR